MTQSCSALLFEPGSKYSYSSAGFVALGGVIERVTGRKFDEFCTTEIFKPLQMNDTVFHPEGDRLKRVAPTDFPERGQVNDTVARGALFPIGGYGHTGWTGQMLWIDPSSRTFVVFLCNRYVDNVADTRPAVYRLHHRLSTLAAEAVKNFDFKNVPGALPDHPSDEQGLFQ